MSGANSDRVRIARLMADGRERTSRDVSRAVGIGPAAAARHLQIMAGWGLIHIDQIDGIAESGGGPRIFRSAV